MTITYNTVALDTASISLNNRAILTITLTIPAAVGTVHGAVTVNNSAFPIISRGSDTYTAELMAFQVKRCTAAPLFIVMADNAGPVEYVAAPLTLTVTDTPGYFPRPLDMLYTWFYTYWDTTAQPCPRVYRQRDLKSVNCNALPEGIIVIKELETIVKMRGQGQYFDGQYPCDIRVLVEGSANAEARFKYIVGEVIRILGLEWNYIGYTEFDYITFRNMGYDKSDLSAGRYEWEIGVSIQSPLRGIAKAPAVPIT